MALETTSTRSRRAILAAGLGAGLATLANALGRTPLARAANNQTVTVGNSFVGTLPTQITNTNGDGIVGFSGAAGGTGLWGYNSSGGYGVAGSTSGAFPKAGVWGDNLGGGIGVYGSSNTGPAVYANSDSGLGVQAYSGTGFGVYGNSVSNVAVFGTSHSIDQPAILGTSSGNRTGVQGCSGSSGLPPDKAKTGVHGYAAQDTNSTGVWGESPTGRAIQGSTTSGYAGYFNGKVYTTKWYELTEIATPGTPSASRARLFIRDSAGKTQLCVKFGNGQVKVLAAQT
jgi:hypothetical protein